MFNRTIISLCLAFLSASNVSVYANESITVKSNVSENVESAESDIASSNKIVAIINDSPVTIDDFRITKKLVKFISHSQNSEALSNIDLNKKTFDLLIARDIVIGLAKQNHIIISQEEIDNRIAIIDKHSGLPEQYTEVVMNEEGIYSEYRAFILQQIILEKFSYSFLYHGANGIGNLAIKQWILENDSPMVDFLIISSSNNRRNYNKMLNLRPKIDCKSINEKSISFANIERISKPLKEIDYKVKDVLNNLQVGENKIITDNSTNTIKCIHLCARDTYSESNIESQLRNRNALLLSNSWLQMMVRQASIQILIPIDSID